MPLFMHLDLANFFVTIEDIFNPGLKEVPFIIRNVGMPREGFVPGFVVGANELAKGYGIVRGPYYDWIRNNNDIKKLDSRYTFYKEVSESLFHDYQKEFSDVRDIRHPHIDDIALSADMNLEEMVDVAERSGTFFIEERYRLSATGISINDAYAHMAAWMSKEKKGEIVDFNLEYAKRYLYGLPVNDFPGIGNALQRKLNMAGIYLIGHIAKTTPSQMQHILGKKNGLNIYESVIGSPVQLEMW